MSRSWSPWTEWFAWHPVYIWEIENQKYKFIWFRKVFRRGRDSYGPSGRSSTEYQYKLNLFDFLVEPNLYTS